MTVSEKVSYIKGLAEGLGLDDNQKNDKLLKAIIDVLEDIAADIEDAQDEIADISDQVDAVDEDLADLEEIVYEDDEDELDDDEFYQVTCPNCNTEIYLDEETLEEDGIACPECGTQLEFDFDFDDADAEQGSDAE